MSPEVRFLFALFMALGLGCWFAGELVAGWAHRFRTGPQDAGIGIL